MATPTDPNLDIGNINNILGVILVCLIIAAYLFGMSSSQAYIYYDRFPKDSWRYKTLVAVVWALDTFHTALMSHTVYYYTVTHFGDFAALRAPPTFSFNLEVVVVPVLALIVQCFFAYRAFSIERNNWPLALAISIFAVTQLAFGLAAAVLAFTKLKGFYDLVNYRWILICWLATGASADLLVTVSLVWTFYKNKTNFNDEDGWMTKILMYGVHTGAITTFTTILDVIFVAVWSDSLVFSGLNYILGKLYTNTLFYALNRRPVSDPRYQSKSGSSSSRNQKSAGHNISSIMPTFAPNHALSAPRVAVRDPYAADVEYENDKAHSLTEEDGIERHNAVDFKVDQHSEVSFVPMDKDSNRGHRSDTDF